VGTGQSVLIYPMLLISRENGNHMTDNLTLGSRLRALRQERALPQRALAERAGVSPNAISLIERDEISPSVATLQRLAAALGVRMSYFFDASTEASVVYSRAGTRTQVAGGGLIIEGIGARLRNQQLEPFHLTLAPNADAGEHVVHTGQEFVCCYRGYVEYEIDGTTYMLTAGDFLLFEASLPHYWRNPTEETAELILILQAPEPSSDLARRHFARYPSVAHIS
jgi:transcriptional regulator with XRE-family HTH domain